MIKNDPAKEFEAQALLNMIANVANGMKAYGGIVGGLNDEHLFQRKVDMENYIRSKSPGVSYWDDLEAAYEKLNPHAWAVTHLSPSGLRGNTLRLLHQLYAYEEMVQSEEADEAGRDKMKGQITQLAATINDPEQVQLFTMLLNEINEDIYPGDNTMKELLRL